MTGRLICFDPVFLYDSTICLTTISIFLITTEHIKQPAEKWNTAAEIRNWETLPTEGGRVISRRKEGNKPRKQLLPIPKKFYVYCLFFPKKAAKISTFKCAYQMKA
jgi:hypothetical protein